jgi:hypothetical protein
MMDLDIGIISEVEKKQKKKLLLEYLCDNLTYHNWWAYRYYFCEMLALVNVIGEVMSQTPGSAGGHGNCEGTEELGR